MATTFLAAVVVLPMRGDQVLALRRAPHKVGAGLWECVSGRLDEGEQPLDAARRELREETGLAGTVHPQPVTSYTAARGTEPMVVVVYRAAIEADAPLTRSDEHDAHRWVTAADFRSLSSLSRLADAIDDAFQRQTMDGSGTP